MSNPTRVKSFGRLTPATWGVVVGLALWTAIAALRVWPTSALSWHFFGDGGTALFGSSGLHLYANNPGYQIGPIAFVISGALGVLGTTGARITAQVLMTIAGPLCITWLVPVLPPRLRGRRVVLALIVMVPGWVILSVRWSHLDDVLAMAFTTLALRAILERRAIWAGIALALAAASKPWAIDFAPLLLILERRAWRPAAIALVGGLAVTWGPFIFSAPGTLHALQPNVLLAPGSGLYALGFRGQIVPAWDRSVAFVVAIGAATMAVLRGRWAGVIIIAVAVRIALDPQNNAYYIGSVATAAVVYDLFGTEWRGPWLTLVSSAVFWQPFTADWNHRLTTTTGYAHWWFSHLGAVGWIHLAWCVGVIALVLFGPRPPAAHPEAFNHTA
jgi:hypothetical protein